MLTEQNIIYIINYIMKTQNESLTIHVQFNIY